MDIFGLLSMVGGLALFLYGMSVMGSGLEKLSGGKLEKLLEKLTTNPFKAIALGAGVTAVIQSSSATTVMVVGFVNSGIMKLSQAIGIIMGTNVGTTMTAWLLSLTGIESSNTFVKLLKPSSFTPVLALIGIFLYMGSKNRRKQEIGSILLGFSVLMFGMDAMSSAVKPLADSAEFVSILTMFENPVLGVIAGAFLTAVIQSSSASVGILQALSVTGVFTYGSVIPIIMGQNIGTCITAVLSAFGANRNAKRTAAVHLFFNIIGAGVFMVFYFGANALFHFSFTNDTVGIAGIAVIHTTFNIFTTLILLPFIKGLEKLAYLVIPITEEEKTMVEDEFILLDDRFLSTPGYAIDQCKTLVYQMAELAKDSFVRAVDTLNAFSQEKLDTIILMENKIDRYQDKLNNYLTRISGQNLKEVESQSVSTLLHCITDLERISDHATNVAQAAAKMNKKGMTFSAKAALEMEVYSKALNEILTRTIMALMEGDFEKAMSVEPLEEVIDHLNKEVKKRHVKRLRKGSCTIEMGLILSEIATDFERVADHCSNIAVYLIQSQEKDLEAHSYVTKLKIGENQEFDLQVDLLAKEFALPER